VTARIIKNIRPGMTHIQIYYAIESAQKELVAEAEKEGPDIRSTVASMYSGNKYYLFRFQRLKDVRLVYAPPQDLGNFGGEVDNWMWPRHTCDFSFLRAYVSKDGRGPTIARITSPISPNPSCGSPWRTQGRRFTFVMAIRAGRSATIPCPSSDLTGITPTQA